MDKLDMLTTLYGPAGVVIVNLNSSMGHGNTPVQTETAVGEGPFVSAAVLTLVFT